MSAADWSPVLIALIAGPLGGLAVSWVQSRNVRAEKIVDARLAEDAKKVDWARQDAVAADAKIAAAAVAARVAEVAAQAHETARLLVDSNERQAETAKVIVGKVDAVHTLVNSDKTEAMQDMLDTTAAHVVSLREIVKLNRAQGIEPSEDALALIDTADTKIVTLKGALADRARQDVIATGQLEEAAAAEHRADALKPVGEGV